MQIAQRAQTSARWPIIPACADLRKEAMPMLDRVCCSCGNCIRMQSSKLAECIETYCAIDGHYIGYVECFTHWCRRWKRERKWDDAQED